MKYLAITLTLTFSYYIWSVNEFRVMFWGCDSIFFWNTQCVVAVQNFDSSTILIDKIIPKKSEWCSTSNIKKKNCKNLALKPEHNNNINGGDSAMVKRRDCVDWMYACSKRQNVTIWYHHFHKSGGSSFVMLAQANGATLMPSNSNGNPLDITGTRIPFWSYNAEAQTKWANEIRSKYGTNMVVTEFNFPNPTQLSAPLPFLYITIVREPVTRLVSNFFWRYRRHFSGLPEPRLKKGESPDFKSFAAQHRNYYIHMLTGMIEGTPIDSSHLVAASNTLETFSVILICEWLSETAELLYLKLGWKINDFNSFHLKENSGLKDYNLIKMAYGNNWKLSLTDENILDISLYKHAKRVATKQLEMYNIPIPIDKNNDKKQNIVDIVDNKDRRLRSIKP